MHADEVAIDTSLVRRLLAEQFPQWADLRLERVPSSGTVNAVYRLGDDLAVRLPRLDGGADDLVREARWLPRMARGLPLDAPVPLGMGRPAEGYPFPWAVCRWVRGEHAAVTELANPRAAAVDLARFVAAIRRNDPEGAPPAYRGGPLAQRDDGVRSAIAQSQDLVDTRAVTAAWESALQAPEWVGPPIWSHSDLLPGNLLAADGRLSAVLDFGCMGVGDPACDAMVAWTYLDAETRTVFRAELDVDDAMWSRARGWALVFGIVALPYYQHTNPEFAAVARRAIDEVLSEY
jgi:aminoglycoside phosphotransferase (APT) family kinase protein